MRYEIDFGVTLNKKVLYENIEYPGVYYCRDVDQYIIVFDTQDKDVREAVKLCLYDGKVESASDEDWNGVELEYLDFADIKIVLINKEI